MGLLHSKCLTHKVLILNVGLYGRENLYLYIYKVNKTVARICLKSGCWGECLVETELITFTLREERRYIFPVFYSSELRV